MADESRAVIDWADMPKARRAAMEIDDATISVTVPAGMLFDPTTGAERLRRGDALIIRDVIVVPGEPITLRLVTEDDLRAVATRLLAH